MIRKEVKRVDISEVKKTVYVGFGNTVTDNVFKSDKEKERASEVVKQLEGMTIREAQEFLSKVSDVLIDLQLL